MTATSAARTVAVSTGCPLERTLTITPTAVPHTTTPTISMRTVRPGILTMKIVLAEMSIRYLNVRDRTPRCSSCHQTGSSLLMKRQAAFPDLDEEELVRLEAAEAVASCQSRIT
jgi:hypothetical protein